MRIIKTPSILGKIFPNILFRYPYSRQSIYLTFDDGPIPEVTPWVLDILDKFSAKATFFLVGENVLKYPDILTEIKKRGHGIGNHTFKHLDGWAKKNGIYFEDIKTCSQLVASSLFRPPYGHLKPSQLQHLKKKYQIVYWDIISYDFDSGLSPKDCLQNLKCFTQNGSIIVFHDSLKSIHTLQEILVPYLEFCRDKGWEFNQIES